MRVRVRSAVRGYKINLHSYSKAGAVVRMIAKMPAAATSLFAYGVLTLYLSGFAAGIASCVRTCIVARIMVSLYFVYT